MDDFLLIWKMKQGNDDALEKFVRKYYSQILQYCRYHCFDMGYAEDLTQETFLKFFGSLQSYHHIGKVKIIFIPLPEIFAEILPRKKGTCLWSRSFWNKKLVFVMGWRGRK